MHYNKIKSTFLILLVSSSIMFTGCVEDIKEKFRSLQGEVTKQINPMPRCSNKEVVLEVNNKLSSDALYGTHAQVKVGTIVLSGTDEITEAKKCKAVVTYTIDKDDNKISSFLSIMPIIKNASKDRTISYTVSRDVNNETFSVHVH